MADNHKWTAGDMPDQTGKTVIITGANSGIGYEAALALARKGALVVLASRNMEKGQQACQAIQAKVPAAKLELRRLDLADLESVRLFAHAFNAEHDALHVLINNAGVMAIPRRTTADGFEMQFGTNHLGHFALTGLLLERIIATPAARVVTVSSAAHRMGTINFDDLQGEQSYGKWSAYGQSKLANLLFAFELQRRLAAAGSGTISVAAHPGFAATNLQFAGPRMEGAALQVWMYELMNKLIAQPAAMGALPTLYAAIAPEVHGCDFIGPDSLGGWRGYPTKVRAEDKAYDEATAQRLWTVSEHLTGVGYTLGK